MSLDIKTAQEQLFLIAAVGHAVSQARHLQRLVDEETSPDTFAKASQDAAVGQTLLTRLRDVHPSQDARGPCRVWTAEQLVIALTKLQRTSIVTLCSETAVNCGPSSDEFRVYETERGIFIEADRMT